MRQKTGGTANFGDHKSRKCKNLGNGDVFLLTYFLIGVPYFYCTRFENLLMKKIVTASKTKAIFSWSGGKDSAYSLFTILKEVRVEVVTLLTTVTDPYQRVSMHGVREELLDLQAKSIDLPLFKIRFPSPCPNNVYEAKMEAYLKEQKKGGVEHVIFGDLFLEDLRRYREEKLAQIGMKGIFPLWKYPTDLLSKRMIEDRFEAVLSCIDPKKVPKEFAGRRYDASLLKDLPSGVDPCGENGEFHSFAFGGPIFKKNIPIQVGERVERDGFIFADILKGPVL